MVGSMFVVGMITLDCSHRNGLLPGEDNWRALLVHNLSLARVLHEFCTDFA